MARSRPRAWLSIGSSPARRVPGESEFQRRRNLRFPARDARAAGSDSAACGEGARTELLARETKIRISSILPVASSRFPVDKAAVSRATKPYSNIRCGSEASENAVYGEYRRCTLRVLDTLAPPAEAPDPCEIRETKKGGCFQPPFRNSDYPQFASAAPPLFRVSGIASMGSPSVFLSWTEPDKA
jgi:hypothetical protein